MKLPRFITMGVNGNWAAHFRVVDSKTNNVWVSVAINFIRFFVEFCIAAKEGITYLSIFREMS